VVIVVSFVISIIRLFETFGALKTIPSIYTVSMNWKFQIRFQRGETSVGGKLGGGKLNEE
jgi:hypothetical protein